MPHNADSFTPEEMQALAPKGMKVKACINPEEKILLTYVYAGDDSSPTEQDDTATIKQHDANAEAKAQDMIEDDPGETIDSTANDTAAS